MLDRPLISATRSLVHSAPCQPQSYSTRLWPSAGQPTRSLRPALPSPGYSACRSFTASSRRSTEKSHYDTLGVSPSATKTDLKRRFYLLSKETHPDINKSDPHASTRFSEISEAYSILGNDEKRRRYDRDVMPRFRRSTSRSSPRSGSRFGSRPPTGLSKRRGTFRGPPPSFYSKAAQNEAERQHREQQAYTAGFGAGAAGSFDARQYASPGQWDPTFNPTPVYKTQSAEDARRNQRRAAEMAAAQAHAEEEGNFWARFVIVSAVVGFGVGVGTIVNRMSSAPRGGMVKGDGSRRTKGDGEARVTRAS